MSLRIPYRLSLKTADFPETSPGVKRVTLILLDGKKIHDVVLGKEGEILTIQGSPIEGISDMGFNPFAIKDVLPGEGIEG